jgi:hypothetical protein
VAADLTGATWRKPSLSGPIGGSCVEVAVVDSLSAGHKADLGSLHVLRDSKDPQGPQLFFTRIEWDVFIAGVKLGEFDHLNS